MSDPAATPAAPGDATADALVSPPATPALADPNASLLAAGNTPPADPNAPLLGNPAPDNAWLPEKYRVQGVDGTLDTVASAKKMAEAHASLEARLGTGDVRPKTPEEYDVKPGEGTEKIDFDAFMADPLSKDFVNRAHAEGFTNKQMNFAINEYLKTEQSLADVNANMKAADAKTELGKLWGDTEVMDRIGTVDRAIKAFGTASDDMPGSSKRLYSKFGNDPDFIAFAAAVAVEVKPDGNSPTGQIIAGSDADVEALQKSKAFWDASDPQHEIVKARVKSYYDRKHNVAG